MIKVDSTKDLLFIEGEFLDIINECSTLVDYCACYYVNNEFNQGVPLDISKEKLREFLIKAVDTIVENVEILPNESSSQYTS